MSTTTHRPLTPPHSRESEMMVLGCMLTSVNSLNAAADSLDDSDFYFTEHKIVFQALKAAFKSDKPADVHLICEELKRQDKLASVGGIGFITTLAQFAGTSAYIEEYVDLVRSKSILRRMILSAQEIEKRALEDPPDVHAALDEAQQKLFSISQSANPGIGVLISDLLSGTKATSQTPYLKELQEKQENYKEKGPEQGCVTGLPTHFIDIDKILNGLNPSNLIILAARPAMGKTALALNIAENVCFRSNIPVGIFSLEMSSEQLLHRLICSQSEVESDKIKTGALNGVEYQRIVAAVNMMQKYTMVIDDQPGLKITDLRARARRMKEAFGIQLLIVDYLQLLSGSGFSRSAENRQNEISEISRMMKTLARELNVPIICLSQLSRKVEDRAGHKPMLSDLRESGCLTGDTLITDAKTGRRIPIRELAERQKQEPISVFAIDENFQVGEHKLVKAFYSGTKQVFELRTRTGKTIKASANHPFRTLSGWQSLDQLKAGDRIACSRMIHPTEEKDHVNFSQLLEPSLSVSSVDSVVETNCRTETLRFLPQRTQRAQSSREGDEGVLWDEIISITPLGIEPVYDATVDRVHNFLANDIFVHNSIEQDADIVMFLFRREYYDPYDKPGQAELIVAKNRHGGVGSILMAYRKEMAQFANYSPLNAAPSSSKKEETDPFASFK